MQLPISGRCLCGKVRYLADAAPLWQMHCHCESCRRATASGFTSFFGIADGHWRWESDEPALYRSSPGVERRFCPQCGTQMSYRTTQAPGEMHFYAATLDDPGQYAPTAHDLADERLPWIVLCDGLPTR
jgi:hypothetical protein